MGCVRTILLLTEAKALRLGRSENNINMWNNSGLIMKNFRNGTDNAVRVVRVLISKSSPGFTRYFVEQEGILYAHASIWAVEVPQSNHRGTPRQNVYACARLSILGPLFQSHFPVKVSRALHSVCSLWFSCSALCCSCF